MLLDETAARRACDLVLPGVEAAMKAGQLKRHALAAMILKPGFPWSRELHMSQARLYSVELGDRRKWEKRYDNFAIDKSMMSLRLGRSTRDLMLNAPHLLDGLDCRYYGGVWHNGIVVGVSGVHPDDDHLIAMMIALACEREALRNLQNLEAAAPATAGHRLQDLLVGAAER